MFWARKSEQSPFRGPTLQESVEKLRSEAQLSKETHLAVWADLERKIFEFKQQTGAVDGTLGQ